ncbi:hypothetical protein [Peribacillus frigoritolerans]|uniref:hypothetical protein n=1 Tax=Peribacillus frigoritolerans TaxID=450367 RepID=UPI002E2452A2|nr:hypothetical protein [Peribacillus frigoritolerans]MED3845716.1 hypothetical protein [Peribacillus frigoritolerans]
MKKYINIVPVLGLIVLLMAMPLFYGVIFLSSFLDFTPTIHPQPGHKDHNAGKIWNGMSKEEYQKIKYVEEQKYKYENEEPAFDPNEPSRFNLFEGGNENDEY